MSREAIGPHGEASDCVSPDGGSYIEPARGGNAREGEMAAYLIVEHKIIDPANSRNIGARSAQ
jgi:hypothetical protein